MQSKVYDLPEALFVGGETHDLQFRLFTDTREPFSAFDAMAIFSVVYLVNRIGTSVLLKPMSIIVNDDGVENILTVTLLPQETVDLYGKYIYQITTQDMSEEIETPSQGISGITNNIDKVIIK